MFIPAVKHLTKSGPVVLVFDGHYSHIGIRLIEISHEKTYTWCSFLPTPHMYYNPRMLEFMDP